MHIKRWLLLLLLGVAIMGLGFGYFLREVYVSYTFPAFMYYVTLQFLPRLFRGILFVCAALGLIGFSVWKLNSSLLSAFIKPERNESIVDIIYNHRYLRRGPEDRRHRRRHGPVDAAARAEGIHRQHHGDRLDRRRRRQLRPAPARTRRPAAR